MARPRTREASWFGAAAVAIALVACNDVPGWRLGDGTFQTCASASDIACSPFSAPTAVVEVASVGDNDEKPTLTSDMLEMYFLSDRAGGLGNGDVWKSLRATTSDPWGTPALVTSVSSTSRETSPAISADGLTLCVSSDRPGGQGGLDIWMSTRPTRSDDWSVPVPVTVLNSSEDEIPRPPGDHLREMPLSRRATSNDPYQIFAAWRAGASSPWTSPVPETSIDTGNVDDDGDLMDDGVTLYLSSDRLNGIQDLFVAERPDDTSPYAPPVALTALNTTAYAERDPWVSPDSSEIYFVSDRTGSRQIFHATR